MHCLFILFLATIVPVRKDVRNDPFLQREFSEENKKRCPGRDGPPSPSRVQIPTAKMGTFESESARLPTPPPPWGCLPAPPTDLLLWNMGTGELPPLRTDVANAHHPGGKPPLITMGGRSWGGGRRRNVSHRSNKIIFLV